ncbi:hypothetical protein DB32_000442 [Sandaracinus amylolyticus]|uniref:Uncharacterized protein n=1 Tax=Sandaracinus amylolyticus TaxID=927083 RepID=A0A0F6VZ25_9BACT|nr:hypothetical protein DB32_000442 [Sandaracinus amylolyticus]
MHPLRSLIPGSPIRVNAGLRATGSEGTRDTRAASRVCFPASWRSC